ncbi:MAG: DEAD/DEAH box helicase [Promethearchaeota archaeon]
MDLLNFNVEELPLAAHFIQCLKNLGIEKLFPPQALGAAVFYRLPLDHPSVVFHREIFEQKGLPCFTMPEALVRPQGLEAFSKTNFDKPSELLTLQDYKDNYLFCIPTGVGKTVLGLLAALEKLPSKTIWVFTLKAIANEKYQEFRAHFGKYIRVGIKTGDFKTQSDEYLKTSDWIICTPESADSLLTTSPSWIRQGEVGLIVLDEIHTVQDVERGYKVEDVIVKAKLREINVVGLSATVQNSVEMAEWLDANLVSSDYRIVPLEKAVIYKNEIHRPNTPNPHKLDRKITNAALNACLSFYSMNEQILCFVDSRRKSQEMAEKMVEVLKSAGQQPDLTIEVPDQHSMTGKVLNELVKYQVAFHMAGLSLENRTAIEDLFRDRKIRAIWATPTLAAGINLPAKRVIQDGYKRFTARFQSRWLPVSEIHQRWGRAGRPQYDKIGYGYIVARPGAKDEKTRKNLKKAEEINRLMRRYVLGHTERIESKYLVERTLYSSILRIVRAHYATDLVSLKDYYAKTLSALQNPESGELERCVKYLIENEFLYETEDGIYNLTKLGNLTADLYIHPQTALIMGQGILTMQYPDPLTVLQIVFSCPDAVRVRVSMREEPRFWDEYYAHGHLYVIPPKTPLDLASIKSALVIEDYMNEVPIPVLEERWSVNVGDLLPIVGSLGCLQWLFEALQQLAAYYRKQDLIPKIREIGLRAQWGVKKGRLSLININYVSRERAISLQNAGYKTIEDVAQADLEILKNVKVRNIKLGDWAKRIQESAKHLVSQNPSS